MYDIDSPKKLFIKTYGCQMNVYDTVRMKNLLRKYGYVSHDDIELADLIILNTCNIREKAAEKVYSELGKIRKLKIERKAKGLETIIAVAGCVSQAEGEEIFKRTPYVDIVVGPQSYQNLGQMVNNIINKISKKEINLEFEADKKFDFLPEESSTQGISSFLTIQEGCDKFCKFCCVPYTRGEEYSRPVPEIYREAMQLAASGAKEITLLGQNVSAYLSKTVEDQSMELGGLIKLIATIPNFERIRYMTSHPNDMQDKLIEAHGTEKKLMPFLHLPVQSGSDKILKDMNRKHTADQYIKLIDKFRDARPDIAFSSDFIVGYPGETEQDFEDTLSLVKEIKYAQCYSFKYSIRPGTPAATNPNQIAEEIKTERLSRLQELLNQQQNEFNQKFVGAKMLVLLDKPGKHANQALGKTEYMQSVHVDNASNYIGEIIEVTITDVHANSLAAVMSNKKAA